MGLARHGQGWEPPGGWDPPKTHADLNDALEAALDRVCARAALLGLNIEGRSDDANWRFREVDGSQPGTVEHVRVPADEDPTTAELMHLEAFRAWNETGGAT